MAYRGSGSAISASTRAALVDGANALSNYAPQQTTARQTLARVEDVWCVASRNARITRVEWFLGMF